MSISVAQQKMFVDGEFVDALSGETMEVLNPATGEVIAEVPRAGEEDVDRAVAAAERAWETWREKTPKDRMELLLKLADVIDENAEIDIQGSREVPPVSPGSNEIREGIADIGATLDDEKGQKRRWRMFRKGGE